MLIPSKNRQDRLLEVLSNFEKYHKQNKYRYIILNNDIPYEQSKFSKFNAEIHYLEKNAIDNLNISKIRNALLNLCDTEYCIMSDDDIGFERRYPMYWGGTEADYDIDKLFIPFFSNNVEDANIAISIAILRSSYDYYNYVRPCIRGGLKYIDIRSQSFMWAMKTSVAKSIGFDNNLEALEDHDFMFQHWVHGYRVVTVPEVCISAGKERFVQTNFKGLKQIVADKIKELYGIDYGLYKRYSGKSYVSSDLYDFYEFEYMRKKYPGTKMIIKKNNISVMYPSIEQLKHMNYMTTIDTF